MLRDVHVHCLEPQDKLAVEQVAIVRACIEAGRGSNALTDDPRNARVVLLIPSFRPMFHWYGRHLTSDPVVMSNFERCFVFEGSDGPHDYLRGCYVSMPATRYDEARHRAIGFLRSADTVDVQAARSATPSRLFCFRGAPSHPLRRDLVHRFAAHPDGTAALMDRWLNYSPSEQTEFWRELGEAKFVLCPRGLGTTTIRLQEAMQSGRVPVIISDNWVAPTGPDWDAFSVRVPESQLSEIPSILRARERDAREMGRIARAEWDRFYAPGAAFTEWLMGLITRLDTPGWSGVSEMRRWRSQRFRWSNGFDPLHRVAYRVRSLSRRSS